MKTVKEVKNELLKRKELLFSFEAERNPGFEASKKIIVEKLKVAPENVAVRSVRGNFGSKEFVVEAFVYENAKDKELIEPKVKPKKVQPGGGK